MANARAWLAVVSLGLVVWPLVVFGPLRWRWGVLVRAGRLLARCAGVRLVGKAPPLAPGRCYLANHASYVDGLVLVLALARPAVLVVGNSLARQHLAGPFLRALDAEFVGPGSGSVKEQLARLEARLREGRDLAGFPEGALGNGPEPQQMRLGLFLAAARADAPVVPVAILGSGRIVPPGTKRAARGPVEVRFGTECIPSGSDVAAARRLAYQTAAQLAQMLAPD